MNRMKPIKKVLIANRGEIACRIIKTLNKLDIDSVAVYSEADANALHVRMADEAIAIGAAPATDSYLVAEKIINAAKTTGANAIHPGYGFLSENADFAQTCTDNDIIFIGPPAKAIESMGSKAAAKAIMETAGVPLVPGYHGDDQNDDLLQQQADDIGYPVLLKAAMGGGGKGMRLVENKEDFLEALQSCRRESVSSFGDDRLLIEKYVVQPRHVEIQVFADQHGQAVYLFERDCSLQRRHQKVVEEAPAPGISNTLRCAMGEAAVRAAKSIGYEGAGTVEFLLDADGQFYFMEMNTRLQVEHPVTEMITGEDLVDWQIHVASGLKLPKMQHELAMSGHAIEVRIYAETPHNEFLPATGKIDFLATPKESKHVRIDTGILEDSEVTVFYDPMIAKLIVWDRDRGRALHRMDKALQNYLIDGVENNIEFLSNIINHENFQNAQLSTHFIDDYQDTLISSPTEPSELHFIHAAIFQFLNTHSNACAQSPWSALTGWKLNNQAGQRYLFDHNKAIITVDLKVESSNKRQQFVATCGGTTYTAHASLSQNRLILAADCNQVITVHQNNGRIALFAAGNKVNVQCHRPDVVSETENDGGQLSAPMHGRIVDVLVKTGDNVEADMPLIIVEAMKMEHTIRAKEAGEVQEVFYTNGDLVEEGAELIQFRAHENESA